MLSLSIRKLCTHSQSSYGVYKHQAHVGFKIVKFSREIIFFILTLSTHVSGFTLDKVIWFTLSKHMLGSKYSNFHGSFFFNTYTLHTCFRIHSPYSYLVHTLQAHVKFKFFKFSREIIFSCLHSPHMFQGSLSIQLFGLHSPRTCWVQNFQIFTRDNFFMLTLSTHVSGFTLHTVIWFTLSKHMLGSKFLNFHRISFFPYLHSPLMFQSSLSMQLFLHSPSRCYISKFYIVIIISSFA